MKFITDPNTSIDTMRVKSIANFLSASTSAQAGEHLGEHLGTGRRAQAGERLQASTSARAGAGGRADAATRQGGSGGGVSQGRPHVLRGRAADKTDPFAGRLFAGQQPSGFRLLCVPQ